MRIVGGILIVVLGIVLLAAALLVVPAHVQTRRIAPPLPDTDDLLALLSEPDAPVRVEYLTIASQDASLGTLGHTVFLVRWADGRSFAIDAGMDRESAAEFAELLQMMWGAGEGHFHGDLGEQLGEDAANVAGVGFTHLHIDHTQGLGTFCAVRGPGAAVYQTRWQAEEHNFNTTEGAEIVETSCLERRPLVGQALLRSNDFPGLGVVALGGHTPGSTLFAVAAGGRLWLFSGDTTNTKASIRDDVGKPFLYSYVLVPENTARTSELRRWLAELDAREEFTVIVSHDLDDIRSSGLPAYTGAPPAPASAGRLSPTIGVRGGSPKGRAGS